MEFNEYIQIIKHKKQTILSVLVLFIVVALILTFVQPFKYEAAAKILVVQSYEPGMDPFQISKSNAYITKTLAKIVSSNSFYQEVLNSGFNINKTYFTDDLKKQVKIWNKTVYAGYVNDSGMINISVYHKDKYQADQILRAINHTLKSKHAQYHGAGDSIAISIIDQPLVSNLPVKPNIAYNLLLSLALGLITALSFVYLFPGKEHDLNLMPFHKAKNKKLRKQESQSDINDYDSNQEVRKAIQKLKTAPRNYPPLESGLNMEHVYGKEAESEARDGISGVQGYEDGLSYEDLIKSGKMENLLKQ
ncbi:MAG: Wzz/FepE/Etk N-terminal domain-containing protein [Patescibacteria group bacterium]|nr:Wzz/FepE/Etk N-terminal domain-containing protein [Patescibacteria group bacterium]